MDTKHAIYNNENNETTMTYFGDIRYSVPGWQNIAGDASPVALMPLTGFQLQLRLWPLVQQQLCDLCDIVLNDVHTEILKNNSNYLWIY